MPLSSDGINYIIGSEQTAGQMPQLKAMRPFEPVTLDFLSALSKILLKTGADYPDVAAFGFWCRRASLEQMKKEAGDLSYRLGCGIVFHSTPSNVPVNFAFSFAAGLLAGNGNIVRLPAKDFPQVQIICDGIKSLIAERYKELEKYICFIKYTSQKKVTDYFSELCDVRMVWGGDMTVRKMEQSPLQPRAFEIDFADRHSICIINAEYYLRLSEKEKRRTAADFYNDTYLSDQNACTSPGLIVWTGEEKQQAQKQFWNRLEEQVLERYDLAPVQAVGKLSAFCRLSAMKEGITLKRHLNNAMWVIEVKNLSSDLMEYKYHSGFFLEYEASGVGELSPILNKKCQTVSCLGEDRKGLAEEIMSMGVRGADRIVPIGKTMDFSLIWDGYDLLRILSRKIDVF